MAELEKIEFEELTEHMKRKLERKIHKVKLISENPWCASVPSEMLAECDTWILKPFQKTCKKGHIIEYVKEAQIAEGMRRAKMPK